MSTTAPATGTNFASAKGTQQEMGDPMGWLMRRTKRLEELISEPEIMDRADRLARHIERYAFEEGVRVQDLEVTPLPAQSKAYIRLNFGAHNCVDCQGTGKKPDLVHNCDHCGGAGHR